MKGHPPRDRKDTKRWVAPMVAQIIGTSLPSYLIAISGATFGDALRTATQLSCSSSELHAYLNHVLKEKGAVSTNCPDFALCICNLHRRPRKPYTGRLRQTVSDAEWILTHGMCTSWLSFFWPYVCDQFVGWRR
ncbi:hypothetical protein K470DRAFT_71887 [Piedraia hortae CBS 480.64]|uniref:Uncharacterized protein n=1 Tax=Piedraia hortae CBS 480.64 TaxID=1314780 RepID=A0A6A7BZA4_9PEZI|nr:hypothetical protein K470DRAFT_71887 [Piedraia hortae CBS 480.64]